MDEPHHMTGAFSRRRFLSLGAGSLALPFAAAAAKEDLKVQLPAQEAGGAPQAPPVYTPPSQRIGYAIVGLGKLALEEVLPAFGQCQLSRPVALVSGDRAKALKVAKQYGIDEQAIYDYRSYDRLADNPQVQAVYNILPNSLHAEYTIRAARAGKHVLCEKPMANSVRECEQMIEACARAGRQLMVAYRSQYEPLDRAIVQMVQQGKLGKLREIIASFAQNMGDTNQWRLKRALAGGGALPDIGIYCLNAARFISGEEPVEVFAQTWSTPGDPRFIEVEEAVRFVLRFPSGLAATCSTSYASARSQFLRVQGSEGWAELDPAFAYRGLRLRSSRKVEGQEAIVEAPAAIVDQFALELDHFSECIRDNRVPHTPGEEGLQDQRIIEALYRSARSGAVVKLSPPPRPTRGPAPRA